MSVIYFEAPRLRLWTEGASAARAAARRNAITAWAVTVVVMLAPDLP